MNKKVSICKLLVILCAGLLVSCASTKEITYLQNLPEGEVQQGILYSTNDYALRVGDNLFIQVTSMNPEVNQLFNPSMAGGGNSGAGQQFANEATQYINGYQLDGDGRVELPIIGHVYLKGATITEAKKILDTKVAEYFKEAMVTVKLLSFKYTVMGEVSYPGVFYNYNNTCTILEAISNARGTTDTSKLKQAKVVREGKDGSYSIDIDLTDKSLLTSPAYYIHPNDVIYVSPDRGFKNMRLNASIYSLMLSTITTAIVVVSYLKD
ncbi:polysaccharide biosynthesis/export family protein [Mangrovibacterium diazotrophicum]|uniref:Polysaccharide export outer membrane protein n=1 Tax=Mangrovibacterium diazotrophicum TaxID=1261403 RepID=A0A419VW18_9BACT|nr:polysaccharide biosynthesis/export family protein [Mangrovibacterium diazotrophicum]RKD86357.1 polysaccharide export outer membrane protein [Mangrovibacterium diazotrophicum]